MNTIASLLEAMTQEDKDDTVIVIFIGEVTMFQLKIFNTISKILLCLQKGTMH